MAQFVANRCHIPISVALRQHLHHFKGARLGVFLAIALHSNADGWAWPSMAVLKAETGYNVQTISQALRDLCVLTIDGQRVLLAVQDRAASGTFASNRYLLFPSDEDVARYAEEEDDPQAHPPLDVPLTAAPRVVAPSTEKPSAVQPDTAAPSTEKVHERSTIGNKNHAEGEPGRERARGVARLPAGQSSATSPPPTEHPAITAYRSTFGKSPTDRQATAIANAVTDITRWARVLDDWQANAWRAESVGKMLDRYHHHDQEHSHAPPSDRRVHADGRAGRPSAAPTPAELARFLNRPRPGLGQHGT
jgi:Helix-turn-helix domain